MRPAIGLLWLMRAKHKYLGMTRINVAQISSFRCSRLKSAIFPHEDDATNTEIEAQIRRVCDMSETFNEFLILTVIRRETTLI